LRKICPFRYRKPPGHQTDLTKIEPLYSILSLKELPQRTEKKWLKAIREKKQTIYTGKLIKITADFSMETLKERSTWSEVYWVLNENNYSPRILYQQNYHSELMEE
jgi:hypothetical protein